MIDKALAFTTMVSLIIHYSLTAPTSTGTDNLNHTISEETSGSISISFNYSFTTDLPTVSPIMEPILNQNDTKNDTNLNSEQKFGEAAQLKMNPPGLKSNLKARKNKNDLYFCCSDDDSETLSFSHRKNPEMNTKSPIIKRKNSHVEEESDSERRPALLLRFFPDGTAVLISKFQLHLHVKPKQIKFEPEGGTDDEAIEFNPSFILDDGKSYEVSYKRLEAIPSSKEQNEFDLDESEERESYSKDLNLSDHAFITTRATTTIHNNETPNGNRLLPINESTTLPNTEKSVTITSNDENKANKTEMVFPVIGDSPFFMMTEEEMSSLQKQYDPAIAAPLQATTALLNVNESNVQETTTNFPTTRIPQIPNITESSSKPSTATIKCLSFKNQLSLALSTEDNIDNSLLKRHIFPTLDCDNSSFVSKPFENLKKIDEFTTVTPSTLPIITRLLPEPTTTPSYTRNNIIPYLASRFSNRPTNPDIFVVTSLPVLIDLKSTRNQPVTNAPAWREVTVGVVRDQQGQPLKPRYNNWTAHLRGLRKKAENKFWNDFTTPKPNIRTHSREPLQQNIQQSPSQVNRAFWTDLQRQNHMSEQRNGDKMNAHMYLTNPPRNHSFQNKFQFWRIRTPDADSRWNSNTARLSEPHRGSYANNGNMENRQTSQWNQGIQKQNGGRW